MKVVSSETEIYLGEIQITKDFQQQGIGTSLIKSVIQEAQANNKKL
jgi:GNAT superfamily N-acetyltransferase